MYHYGTHEYEEGVDIIRVVRDHVFVMTQDLLLDEVPPSERISTRSLSSTSDEFMMSETTEDTHLLYIPPTSLPRT